MEHMRLYDGTVEKAKDNGVGGAGPYRSVTGCISSRGLGNLQASKLHHNADTYPLERCHEHNTLIVL